MYLQVLLTLNETTDLALVLVSMQIQPLFTLRQLTFLVGM